MQKDVALAVAVKCRRGKALPILLEFQFFFTFLISCNLHLFICTFCGGQVGKTGDGGGSSGKCTREKLFAKATEKLLATAIEKREKNATEKER